MNKYLAFVLLGLLVAAPVSADTKHQHKAGGAVAGTITVTATVQEINYKTREVTLKSEDGEVVHFKVGPVAHNFDRVKKGDKVTFDYMEAIALDVRKADGPLSKEAEVNIARAPKGANPAGVIAGTVTLTAAVESIDYTTRHVTLKGPEGNTVTLKVGEQAKNFNEVKQGDHVVVQYTEALGISVTTPKS